MSTRVEVLPEPRPQVEAPVGSIGVGAVATNEWRANWPLVVSSMAGLAFASVAGSSIGVFMEPLSKEFGWSRAAVAGGLSIFAAIAVPLAPLAGGMIDRWGSRRLAIPGLIASMALFAAFSLANGSVVQWLLLWALYALAACSIKAPVWTTAVTGAFSAGRGLALSVTLCGTAVAQMLAPITAQWLIDAEGWRMAYVFLGLGWGLLALALVVPFFYDARDRQRKAPVPAALAPTALPLLQGLSLREAMRNKPMLKIVATTLITNFLLGGVLVHQVPLLREHGIPATVAAAIAGLAGIASLFGKLSTGWLLDRLHGDRIAGLILASPAIAFLMLLQGGGSPEIATIAVIILGYVTGAQFQLCAYLTGRYAGLRYFGRMIGVISAVMVVGIGSGPVVVGVVFDHFHSYSPMLTAAIPITLLCGLLHARLGPYPDWTKRGSQS